MHPVRVSIFRVSAFRAAVLSFLAALVLLAPRSYSASTAVLHCTIIDAASGEMIPARVRILTAAGENIFPPVSTCFFHSQSGGYFYANGSFSVNAPKGFVRINTRHGFEWTETLRYVNVRVDTSIVIALRRVVSMDTLGWYSGDCHVHINHIGGYYVLHPENALLMGSAEGLNVVNCLDNSYCFTGAPDPCSTPRCIVFMAEEVRSSIYGHLDLLGMSSLVSPSNCAWWPMLMDISDSLHAYPGALIISAHPVTTDSFEQVESWPGSGLARELPVDAARGRMDAVDVASYSNLHDGGVELDMWYRLLNCGFKLPASAGTDAAMNQTNSLPAGGFRVYVRIPGHDLSYESWLEGLSAGRTFVTNGPLITQFQIKGIAPGDCRNCGLAVSSVSGSISVRSVNPIQTVEIVMNGVPAVTFNFSPGRGSVDTSFSLTISESAWVAARVYGPRGGWLMAGDRLFAHTSPIYFTVGGGEVCNREDASYFVQWIENLESLAQAKGQWSDASQSSRVFAELAAARHFYEDLACPPVTEAHDSGAETPSALYCANAPNPFGGETEISFEVPGTMAASVSGPGGKGPSWSRVSIAVYDVSGRLVRRLVDAPMPAGRHKLPWDGRDERGRLVASGVYFAKLSAASRALTTKMLLVR